MKDINQDALYVIYDGECYFCNHTAKALKIKKAVNKLILINARESHELVIEAIKQGLDVNEGIVVYYNQQFYYAKKAVNLLNSLADKSTFREKLAFLFYKNKLANFLGYPLLKTIRNLYLAFKHKPKIQNKSFCPIFKPVFGENWDHLPEVIKKHYANRPYSNDIVRAKGLMTITFSPMMKIIAPFLSVFKIFAPAPGIDIPVEVDYLSSPKDQRFIFDRRFFYPHLSKPFEFKSTLWKIRNNLIVDALRFGLGIKFIYQFDGSKVQFIHSGYILLLGKLRLPLPLTFLLGKGYGEETPLTDSSFHFFLESIHPLFGQVIRYEGTFTIIDE